MNVAKLFALTWNILLTFSALWRARGVGNNLQCSKRTKRISG